MQSYVSSYAEQIAVNEMIQRRSGDVINTS